MQKWSRIPRPEPQIQLIFLARARSNFQCDDEKIIQAAAVWQWFNFLKEQVPGGKAVLRINMGETSVCLFQGDSKGTVVARKRKIRGHAPGGAAVAMEPAQKVSRSMRRTCVTHVAFVCDRPDIQPLLPQVVVGNERTFPATAFAGLQGSAPRNVHLVRQKSAWNNSALLVSLLKALAAVLAPYLDELQPIFLMDACKVHITQAVLQACWAGKLWPVLVPARLTWLLAAALRYSRFLEAQRSSEGRVPGSTG